MIKTWVEFFKEGVMLFIKTIFKFVPYFHILKKTKVQIWPTGCRIAALTLVYAIYLWNSRYMLIDTSNFFCLSIKFVGCNRGNVLHLGMNFMLIFCELDAYICCSTYTNCICHAHVWKVRNKRMDNHSLFIIWTASLNQVYK